jgi:transposase-like protein
VVGSRVMRADREKRRLRSEIARAPRGPGRRYPPELQQRVLAWVGEEHQKGVSLSSASEALGLPLQTLLRWRRPAAPSPKLAPVEVVADHSRLTAVSPSGIRIEGLTIEQAAALLRAAG